MTGERERLLRKGDYVWGSFVKPERVDGYVVGVNPGDRSDVLGRFPFSESSVDEAMEAGVAGGVRWRRLSLKDRATIVRRLREVMSKHQQKIATLVTRETGKPVWESRQEVVAAIRAVDLLLDEGLALLEPRVLDQYQARSDYRPRGVVGILAPYNLPILIPVLQIAAAMLAGNTVVYKPSKFTPGVGQAIAEALDRCRLPRGVFNLVQGSGSGVGQRIATSPSLDALLFSGSYQTATAIRRSTYERPELSAMIQTGGKGCGIVLDGCDLDRAVYETLVGAFLTAGQRHNSTARVMVVRKVFDEFCDHLVRHASRVRVGYGFDANSFLGPVISENFRTRYRRFGRSLVQRGHTPLIEAANRDVRGRRGFYVNPAIYWVNWENGHGFLEQEPPGPSLLVYRVASWEEAVALHNQLAYRVSTSLFANPDHPKLDRIIRRLRTGSLNVNRGTIGASLRLPSVGLGRASNGVPGGLDLLRFLTTPRAVLMERRPFDASQVVPGIQWQSLGSDDPATVAVSE